MFSVRRMRNSVTPFFNRRRFFAGWPARQPTKNNDFISKNNEFINKNNEFINKNTEIINKTTNLLIKTMNKNIKKYLNV